MGSIASVLKRLATEPHSAIVPAGLPTAAVDEVESRKITAVNPHSGDQARP